MQARLLFLTVSTLCALVLPCAHATNPDCTDLGCHILAYCEFNASQASVCNCQPGTIDKSGGLGQNCDKSGYTVRYVVDHWPEFTPQNITDVAGFNKCVEAEGYYVNNVFGKEEVNCLYSTKPANTQAYSETSPEGHAYYVRPHPFGVWLYLVSKVVCCTESCDQDNYDDEFKVLCSATPITDDWSVRR